MRCNSVTEVRGKLATRVREGEGKRSRKRKREGKDTVMSSGVLSKGKLTIRFVAMWHF